MDIILKNLRFTHYDPDSDIETDIRPLTKEEAEDIWHLFARLSEDDYNDEACDFAEKRTDGQATGVEWDVAFEETG